MKYNGQSCYIDIIMEESVNDEKIKSIMKEAIKEAGMNIVDFIEHIFSPQGGTYIWILSESHASCHTYPEHNYISIDFYTCGEEGKPEKAIKLIKEKFKILKHKEKYNKRGDI